MRQIFNYSMFKESLDDNDNFDDDIYRIFNIISEELIDDGIESDYGHSDNGIYFKIVIPTNDSIDIDFNLNLTIDTNVSKNISDTIIKTFEDLEQYAISLGMNFQYLFVGKKIFATHINTKIKDKKYRIKNSRYVIIYFNENNKNISESKDLNDLSNDDMDEIVESLSNILNDMKVKILDLIEVNLNIDVKEELDLLKEEFGEDVIRELNIEALFRKLYQIIVLKKGNVKERISNEIDSYLNSLEIRLQRQKETLSDDDHFDEFEGEYSILPRKKYEKEKFGLQVELMKLQEWVVKNNKKVAIVFEGRDAAGKGSTIKRFIEYMNPKYFRVVALGIPTEEEKNNWFGRYEKHLPKEGEIVFFDRSWYNRGVVEPVMGYCTEEQYNDFMDNVVNWEESLIREGVILIKLWFSITKEKQQQRFKLRQESPLKYWKFSPNDAKVVDKFEMIGDFKNIMFQKTSTRTTPWVVINSNDKKVGRLNAIRYTLDKIDYDDKDESKCEWYPEVVNVLL